MISIANRTSALPDYKHMVPIRVGDFLEYSGIQAGGETICYSIVVNIDITTSGAQPGFVRVEDALIGVADASVAVEAARYRVFEAVLDCEVLLIKNSLLGLPRDPTCQSLSGLSIKIHALGKRKIALLQLELSSQVPETNGSSIFQDLPTLAFTPVIIASRSETMF